MSFKNSCFSLLVVVISVFICSCGAVDSDAANALSFPFTALITVTDGEGNTYRARVELSSRDALDTSDPNGSSSRNGKVVYLSPESISDITAVRSGGVVSIGIGEINVTPSASIGHRYVRLLDLLDLSDEQLAYVSEVEHDGKMMLEASYSVDGRTVKVVFDREMKHPISLSDNNILITFDEFSYT